MGDDAAGDACRERGVDIGAIGGIRVDPAGFNTEADIDRLLDALPPIVARLRTASGAAVPA